MRKDMSKVIMERPRSGGREMKGRKANIDLDNLPTKEGMGHKTHQDYKSMGGNYNPLRRFLLKQVGRPWSKVYSEIRTAFNRPIYANMIALDYLKYRVHTNVEIVKEGKQVRVFEIDAYKHRIELHKGDLYVDPEDGILKEPKAKRERFRWREKVVGSIEQRFVAEYNWLVDSRNTARPVVGTHAYNMFIKNRRNTVMELDEKGVLWRVFIDKATDKFSRRTKATALLASQDHSVDSLYRLIEDNLDEAMKSKSEYIRAWARYVEERRERQAAITAHRLVALAQHIKSMRIKKKLSKMKTKVLP